MTPREAVSNEKGKGKDCVVYFDLYYDDEESEAVELAGAPSSFSTWGFVAYGVGDGLDGKWLDSVKRKLEDEFGVHDRVAAPSREVGSVGFALYECDRDSSSGLANAWRNEFVEKFGNEAVGKPVGLGNVGMRSDFDVYRMVKSMSEGSKKRVASRLF